jgi:hypothetical protein
MVHSTDQKRREHTVGARSEGPLFHHLVELHYKRKLERRLEEIT